MLTQYFYRWLNMCPCTMNLIKNNKGVYNISDWSVQELHCLEQIIAYQEFIGQKFDTQLFKYFEALNCLQCVIILNVLECNQNCNEEITIDLIADKIGLSCTKCKQAMRVWEITNIGLNCMKCPRKANDCLRIWSCTGECKILCEQCADKIIRAHNSKKKNTLNSEKIGKSNMAKPPSCEDQSDKIKERQLLPNQIERQLLPNQLFVQKHVQRMTVKECLNLFEEYIEILKSKFGDLFCIDLKYFNKKKPWDYLFLFGLYPMNLHRMNFDSLRDASCGVTDQDLSNAQKCGLAPYMRFFLSEWSMNIVKIHKENSIPSNIICQEICLNYYNLTFNPFKEKQDIRIQEIKRWWKNTYFPMKYNSNLNFKKTKMVLKNFGTTLMFKDSPSVDWQSALHNPNKAGIVLSQIFLVYSDF